MVGEHDAPESVDRRSLERLRGELGNDGAAVQEFISIFVRLWPRRLSRVSDAVLQTDSAALADAALSIRSAGGMVGAVHLSELADECVLLARRRDFVRAGELVPCLSKAGDRAVTRLAQLTFV